MSKQHEIVIDNLLKQINSMKLNIEMPTDFTCQVHEIDRLYSNDKSGLVSSIVDLMVEASCVNTNIETNNDTYNDIWKTWQEDLINMNTNIGIPHGLKALSEQYYRERWRSSFLGLNLVFETVTIDGNKIDMPTKAWFVNGGALGTKPSNTLDGKKYFLNSGNDEIDFKSGKNNTVFIRRPYCMWHENTVTPYLVRRGVLYNWMVKCEIRAKQAELIEAIIPYILKLQSGNDAMAKEDLLPTQAELDELKEDFKKRYGKNYRRVQDLIASISHDTEISHLIPDLTKAFDPIITKSVDRDIMSGLGMIEFEGFSSSRQEAMMNPTGLVTEVKDAVRGWNELVKSIINATVQRNIEKNQIPKLLRNKVTVNNGVIETFISDKLRDYYRTLSDRGIISLETTLESTTDINYQEERKKRIKEKENGDEEIMYPRVIMNQEQQNEEVLDDRQQNTPEANNFNMAVEKVLPLDAKELWYATYNRIGSQDTDAENIAWSEVKKEYRKVPSVTVWEKI